MTTALRQAEEVVDVESEYTGVKGHGTHMQHTVCQGCTASCGFQDVLANISGGTCPYLRSHGRRQLCTAGTLRPETDSMQWQPKHGTSTRMPKKGDSLEQETCKQATFLLLLLASPLRQGRAREELFWRHHSHP